MNPAGALRGVVRVPGDKSVSHRAVMLASLASGRSRISGLLDGGDCRATLDVMGALGVEAFADGAGGIVVDGRGLEGLGAPDGPLDCASSGTTMRLLAGVLAAQRFDSRLTGTRQLLGRPMGRIIEPLAFVRNLDRRETSA
ncbi:MAG: hypothetical protein JRG91_02180 [Deltaproteobacteria bacterium]|nr:hypothetical protein [Deltaproteobacteria bacterium]